MLREVQDDPDLVVQVARPGGSWSRLDGTPIAVADGYAIEAGGDVIATVQLGWDSLRTTAPRRRRACSLGADRGESPPPRPTRCPHRS